MADRLKPLVDWMYQEILGIEELLRKVAPRYHISNGEVVTGPKELETPGGASGAVQRAPRDPASTRAWAALPTIPHAVGEPPLVAPNRPFAAGLAANEPPPPILAPLSHGRSLEAPRGLVVGIARPTQAPAGPALPPAVQRAPLGAPRRFTSEATLPDVEARSEDSAASPSPPSAPAAAIAEPPGLGRPAVRRLVVAEPGAPSRTLTRAPETAQPRPPVGRVGQPRAAGPASGVSAAPAATAAVQRASIEPPASKASPVVPPGPSTPTATAMPRRTDAPRLTIGQARRLGLGAPISGGPAPSSGTPTASVQRAPLDPSSSSALVTPMPRLAPPIQRAPAEPLEMPLDLPLASGHHDDDGHDHTAGPAPQRAPMQAASSGPDVPVLARPIAGPSGVGVLPSAAPERVASPIISARPLRGSVQRAPLTLPAKVSDEANGAAAGGTTQPAVPAGNVKIHRGTEAAQLASALDARSFTHQGEIFMPDSHGPLTTGKGRALLAHELTHVGQQRRLGSSLPPEHTPAGRALEAEAAAAERAPDMTLASQPGGGSRATGETAAPATPATASPEPSEGPSPIGKTLPQRAPLAARESRTGPGHSPSREGRSEQDLEVLAHQLYQRIGRHLRRELLVDRERSGFAVDLP